MTWLIPRSSLTIFDRPLVTDSRFQLCDSFRGAIFLQVVIQDCAIFLQKNGQLDFLMLLISYLWHDIVSTLCWSSIFPGKCYLFCVGLLAWCCVVFRRKKQVCGAGRREVSSMCSLIKIREWSYYILYSTWWRVWVNGISIKHPCETTDMDWVRYWKTSTQ